MQSAAITVSFIIWCSTVHQELRSTSGELFDISSYQFDGAGKYFRPMIVMLTSRACNWHASSISERSVSSSFIGRNMVQLKLFSV